MSEPDFLSLAPAPAAATSAEQSSARPLAQTSAGRVSGKAWKSNKAATVYVPPPPRSPCSARRSRIASSPGGRSFLTV